MIKRILLILALVLGVLGLTGYIFYSTSDQFGADLEHADLKAYANSTQFNGQQFINQIATPSVGGFIRGMEALYEFLINDAQT